MSRFSSEAYDFSLFEERHTVEEQAPAEDAPRWDNTQPQEEPRKEQREDSRENVVELPKKELDGVLRISFSKETTREDVEALVEGLVQVSKQLFTSLS